MDGSFPQGIWLDEIEVEAEAEGWYGKLDEDNRMMMKG